MQAICSACVISMVSELKPRVELRVPAKLTQTARRAWGAFGIWHETLCARESRACPEMQQKCATEWSSCNFASARWFLTSCPQCPAGPRRCRKALSLRMCANDVCTKACRIHRNSAANILSSSSDESLLCSNDKTASESSRKKWICWASLFCPGFLFARVRLQASSLPGEQHFS